MEIVVFHAWVSKEVWQGAPLYSAIRNRDDHAFSLLVENLFVWEAVWWLWRPDKKYTVNFLVQRGNSSSISGNIFPILDGMECNWCLLLGDFNLEFVHFV